MTPTTGNYKVIRSLYEKELIKFFQLCEEYDSFMDDYETVREVNGIRGGVISVLFEQAKEYREKFVAIQKTLLTYKDQYGLCYENDLTKIKLSLEFLDELNLWLSGQIKKTNLQPILS
jgi:hypothetical protein